MNQHSALASQQALLDLLATWSEWGWLRELDRSLAQFFAELEPQAEPLLLLAAALASHQLGQGHVCLDLQATLADPDFALSMPPEGDIAQQVALLPSAVLQGVTLTQWQHAVAASALVNGSENAPLVLQGHTLYLRRYFDYEQRVAGNIAQRLAFDSAPEQLAAGLNQLFPPAAAIQGVLDWQKLACAMAASGRFTLITGGPGTGKTTTVVRLLALLQASAMAVGAPLRLSLAAPTGKAAARLTESIGGQISSLPVSDAVKAQIPAQVTTLHRLLGSRPDSRHFRHHAGNLLPLDVLVVDEASMIDLEMMDSLLAALPKHARLLLLGDKDQLASVEAGAVLGDLCSGAERGGYSAATQTWLHRQTGEDLAGAGLVGGDNALDQRIVMLRHSRRFGSGSGIGQLARAVNNADASAARGVLKHGYDDVHGLSLTGESDPALERLLIKGGVNDWYGYQHYLGVLRQQRPQLTDELAQWDEWAGQVLQAFDCFQLLCAVRRGPWGVEALNQRIAAALTRRKLLNAEREWYEGRPVLVTRNDYSLGLMNGDIGIALMLPERDGQGELRLRMRVVFARNDGSGQLRHILPSRLADVETVFAMTVHKSQGSEFAHCALLVPDRLSPVLTKELIYTGITRAKRCFTLIESSSSTFEQAVQRRVQRRSGLRLALDGYSSNTIND